MKISPPGTCAPGERHRAESLSARNCRGLGVGRWRLVGQRAVQRKLAQVSACCARGRGRWRQWLRPAARGAVADRTAVRLNSIGITLAALMPPKASPARLEARFGTRRRAGRALGRLPRAAADPHVIMYRRVAIRGCEFASTRLCRLVVEQRRRHCHPALDRFFRPTAAQFIAQGTRGVDWRAGRLGLGLLLMAGPWKHRIQYPGRPKIAPRPPPAAIPHRRRASFLCASWPPGCLRARRRRSIPSTSCVARRDGADASPRTRADMAGTRRAPGPRSRPRHPARSLSRGDRPSAAQSSLLTSWDCSIAPRRAPTFEGADTLPITGDEPAVAAERFGFVFSSTSCSPNQRPGECSLPIRRLGNWTHGLRATAFATLDSMGWPTTRTDAR